MPKGQHRATLWSRLAVLPVQREKSLTEKCSWMSLKAVCQVVKGSLHLIGASHGRGRREISIPKLPLSHWQIKNWTLSGKTETTPGRNVTCVQHTWASIIVINLDKPYRFYPFPVSSVCFLIVFKEHFSSAEPQHVLLFIPLPQTAKRMLSKKHPKELNVINLYDADQLSLRALTHSSHEVWIQYTFHYSKSLLGEVFPSNDLSVGAAILPCWSHSSSLPLPPQPLSTFQSHLWPSLAVVIPFGPVSDKDFF